MEAHCMVNEDSKKRNEDKLEVENQFLSLTRHRCHKFSGMEKARQKFRDLEPFIRKGTLEKLRRMSLIVHSKRIEKRHIAAA